MVLILITPVVIVLREFSHTQADINDENLKSKSCTIAKCFLLVVKIQFQGFSYN